MDQIKILMELEKLFNVAHAEFFRNVKGFEGLYQVSNLGNVKSLITNKILKPVKDKKGYLRVLFYNDKMTKNCKIHRLVCEAFIEKPLKKECIDHIDHNRSNNNILNLRWATRSENNMNKSKQKNNSSGVTGISWSDRDNIWHARITIQRKTKSLGYFKNKIDAIKARKDAEIKYFGEFRNKQN